MFDDDGSRMSAAIAAPRLEMSRERVIRMIQSGMLAGGCVAGRWLVSREAVEQFVAAREAAVTTEASDSVAR